MERCRYCHQGRCTNSRPDSYRPQPHNAIQHDAALTRNDLGYGPHFTRPNQTLVDQLLALADNEGYLTPKSMAKARRLREAQSKQWNPNYTLPIDLRGGLIAGNLPFLALDQAAIGLLVIGDERAYRVHKDRFRFFLENERLPVKYGWKRPVKEISGGDVFWGIGRTLLWKLWLDRFGGDPVSPTGVNSGPLANPHQEY